MPTAKDRPCPSEPVNASTPGTLDSEWAPRRLPRRQKDRSSDMGKNPISARTGYKAKQPCPLLRMNLSRSSQSWLLGSTRRTPPLYSATRSSGHENDGARCAPASPQVISTISLRTQFAVFSNPAIFALILLSHTRVVGFVAGFSLSAFPFDFVMSPPSSFCGYVNLDKK